MPRSRKSTDQLRRTNAPETWTILPAEGCKTAAPKWPTGHATADEAALWKRLWALPVAAYWHQTRVEPSVVARYVRLALAKPEHASVSRLETDLGLTPAALLRMRLLVEAEQTKAPPAVDPYEHLKMERER